ncbi:MAG: glycosyltransferase family 4 protein [Gemmatimonadaceae bacterium]
MRVLVVNWQDLDNPMAGGAEIHLHEIFGRLTRAGHDVTLLCGGWPNAPATAEIDGMHVHRVGTRYTFPFHARAAYRRLSAAQPFDVIVEDINKVPLYTPRWVSPSRTTPVVALIPHLFGDTVFQEAPFPLASIVWLLERPIPRIYRRVPFQAISQSTADDLVQRGIPRENIAVIYCGIDTAHYTPALELRAARPTFAYLGRLKRYKRVDLIIRAFAALQIADAKLEIAGAGDDRPRLEQLTASLDLIGRVTFLGRISEAEKLSLLRRSWALVFTSPKEGWGITNLEAAACGTPVVASNSPGIRESVRDGETGFLVPHGDVAALASALRRLAQSPRDVAALGAQARAFARGFTWERAAHESAANRKK